MKIKQLLLTTVAILSFGLLQAQVTVGDLTCEYQTNPMGIDAEKPRFGWKLFSDQQNVAQSAYEVRVATSEKNLRYSKSTLWNSGRVNSDQSFHVEYGGEKTKPAQRLYWKVRVWDNKGKVSKWSEAAYWENGLGEDEEWNGVEWISAKEKGINLKSLPSQYFRKEFGLKKGIKRARVYATALGIYSLYVNGQRVGRDLFAPGWTSYHKVLQYQSYDVTSMLESANTIGATVADGWYRGFLGYEGHQSYYGDKLGLFVKLVVEYNDGSEEVISTNDSWKYGYGAIQEADFYNGEVLDMRIYNTAWAQNGFDDSSWKSVELLEYPKDHIVATEVELPRVIEEFDVIKTFVTPKGELVADFGQNFTGWVRLKVNGKSGDKVQLKFAEILDDDGNFYTQNLRRAKATDTFILKDGEQILEPHFTYHGFRYVQFIGLDSMPNKEDVTGVVIHTPMKKIGNFSCSDPMINQLQSNIVWGQRGNFIDVPTDCPQRDERMGWTGDAQVFASTAAFNYNVANFYTKWLRDLEADQSSSGIVPLVVPTIIGNSACCGWSDAGIIIPWTVYRSYGDTRILEKQYESMSKWLAYVIKMAGDNHLWQNGAQLGDWLAYAPAEPGYPGATTEKDLIATAYYRHISNLMATMAKALGKDDDAEYYRTTSDKVKAAFNEEFVTPNGRLVSHTQTAYLMAIAFDMINEDKLEAVKKNLAETVQKMGHLTTGFLGTPLLCSTLSDIGRDDLAFMLLKREEYPSWLFAVTQGATTIWERWNSITADGKVSKESWMNSFNHYSYGAVGDWMYRHIAGIDSFDNSPGYKHFLLSPHVGGGLTHAEATFESIYGEIESTWRLTDGKFTYNVVIPANSSATVVLPQVSDLNGVTMNGAVVSVEQCAQNNGATLELGSGKYEFEYTFKE